MPKLWARVRQTGAHGLRRGAWYAVVNDSKPTIVFLDVHRKNVAMDRTLLDLRPADGPVAIGLGGGHYVPRHSDVAFARRVAFGHLLSTRVLESADPGILDAAVARTPEARIAYVHRKSLGKADLRAWETRLESLGLRVVREADLDALRAKTS